MPTLAPNAKKTPLLLKSGEVHDSIQIDGNPDVVIWGTYAKTKVFVRGKKGDYVEASVFVVPMPPLRSVQGW